MNDNCILLAHGGGGSRTRDLLANVILPPIANPDLDRLDDGACLTLGGANLVLTTDSYVIDPIFFPGGDIGRLAVCGTVNDLTMQGAEPRYLSLGLILEEGLLYRDLERIMQSLGQTARECGIRVVTGDTKVVERGRGGGIYINTTGIGLWLPGIDTHVANARPGDAVIITGTVGDHGVAVMSLRKGLKLESNLLSDTAPLWDLMRPLFAEVSQLHALRDPTRGGLAAALNDIAAAANVGIRLQEAAIPLKPEVRGACQLLGLDPLNVANEGKALVICAEAEAEQVLRLLKAHPLGRDAAVIGRVEKEPLGMVLLETILGGTRIVGYPSGEDLPRIC